MSTAAHAVAGTPTSYREQRGTRLWELLESGAFQVVRGQYFVDRHGQRERIQMRQEIAPMYVWEGPEVVERWDEDEAFFLVAVSYSWLDRDHPDPDLFHLERLSELVQAHWKEYTPVGDIGIILDYCSLSQRKLVDGVDSRSPADIALLKAGLEEINTVYGHARIMGWRLEQVPAQVPRKYADRGWTLFESVIIDAKVNSYSGPNVRVLRDEGGAEGSSLKRGPALTPERFDHELARRGEKAQAKGVAFFLDGKEDLPLVRRKYRDSFAELSRAPRLWYSNASHWGGDEVAALLEALPAFGQLRDLRINGLRPEVGGVLAQGLAELLSSGACPHLLYVALREVSGLAAARLRLAWAARHPNTEHCLEEIRGWCCLCWCCGRECSRVVFLDKT